MLILILAAVFLMAGDAVANGKSHFQFSQNRMQIAIGTSRNFFEAKAFSAPDVTAMRETFRKDLEHLTMVLDEMLLHERLFGNHAEN